MSRNYWRSNTMSGTKAFQTILCVPGRNYPNPDKKITAKVTDGEETKFFTFGPDVTKRRIIHALPVLWQDFRFDCDRKKRGARRCV
jgi:hypothetical protein